MIRRSPTQIDMTDLDVQDIRDHIAMQVAQEAEARNAASKNATADANTNQAFIDARADAAAAAARALEKERRLGIRG
ncbi:hypothetical protein ONZ45_g16982 [Pleurotus djamor]|nr:hypothetical protein ONZ45_g16982 [Pleurotus djamor]